MAEIINFVRDAFMLIPDLLSWLPKAIEDVLLIGVGVAVAYQVLGR